MSKWLRLDYPGWEQADFSNMKWKFDQPGHTVDYRELKRISATEWLIINDHGEFHNYAYYCGPESPEGKQDTECIEAHYQSYLKELS